MVAFEAVRLLLTFAEYQHRRSQCSERNSQQLQDRLSSSHDTDMPSISLLRDTALWQRSNGLGTTISASAAADLRMHLVAVRGRRLAKHRCPKTPKKLHWGTHNFSNTTDADLKELLGLSAQQGLLSRLPVTATRSICRDHCA